MYNNYFGFRESPFSVTPDPRFFYTNPVYLEAYAALRYGIEAKKGFIVVTGEVGTGKTTLLRKLLHNVKKTVRTILIFNTHLSFPELLQSALLDLGLTAKNSSKFSLLQELQGYLIEQAKSGHTVAALIDEAQDLSDEVLEDLRLLSNLETDREKLLQIVLVGQPELQAKLDQPSLRQLKQRVAMQCRLDPLKDLEVGPYIDFRLRAAGYTGKALFQRDAVREIAFHSKGIPRLMNILCDNALLTAYAESKKTVSAQMIDEAARDLRLEPPAQRTEVQPVPVRSLPETGWRSLAHKISGRVQERKLRGPANAALVIVFGILVFAALPNLMNRPALTSTAENNPHAARHDPGRETAPRKAQVPVELNQEDVRVTIQRGATIYQIAIDAYGANTLLGMDLIKEFNPQIENLNWVYAGRDLLLPPLTRRTLLRQQPDGSYQLIVGSFRSRAGADEFGRLLADQRYRVTITTRKVSDDLSLHRVAIDGLRSLEQANQIWQIGIQNQWLPFADNAKG
jgi:general secretion pathway protein A